MQSVKRFTTAYDPAQDRVRITLEQTDASVQVLWLTRRLLVRLVPEIVKILTTLPKLRRDAQSGGKGSMAAARWARSGRLHRKHPVGYQDAESETLVSSMRARLTRQAVLIDFKEGEQTLQTLACSTRRPCASGWRFCIRTSIMPAGRTIYGQPGFP